MIGFQSALALSGLLLVPFGSVDELAKTQNPYFGFEAQGPVLWMARIEKRLTQSCAEWTRAVLAETQEMGVEVSGPIQEFQSWNSGFKEWEPWGKNDLEAVVHCHKFPCAVKFDSNETSQMAGTSEENRLQKFKSLVMNRTMRAFQTQERKEYEFPGVPVEPWGFLASHGFLTSLTLPLRGTSWLRKIDFAPGSIRTIRQVLERRIAENSSGTEAVVWVRDAYTDHYFDGWGEWIQVSCDSGTTPSQVRVVHALVVELDELKKSNLLAQLMRGKVKSAVEKAGRNYLDQAFIRISNRVQISMNGLNLKF